MPSAPARTHAEIEVWGTIVFIDCAGAPVDQLQASIAEVTEYFHHIDRLFSTYKPDSEVSRLRRGEMEIEDASLEVQEVWDKCLEALELTDGSFDPWCVDGGFDPSGYVKGWAADRAIAIMKKHGATSVQVNAAGDLSLAGGYEGKPWSIGIRSPDDAHTVVKVFEITDGAIATSGTYEKGSHIKDPGTNLIAIGARSATVSGPDGGLCEALATALIVAGQDGAHWFGKPELAGYQAWVINRHEDTAWGIDSAAFGAAEREPGDK